MYDIYIKNYLNSSGTVTTTETLMYSIPLTSTYQDNIVIDPVVSCEMGKTGSLEFTIRQNNPYYGCWQQMRTIIRVVYDGTTIFRGRALTIDNTLDGAKKLHFEGDMAFLLDTHQPGVKEEDRTEITILAYLQRLISRHNTQMDDNSQPDKADHKFTLGEVPGQYSNSITSAMRVNPDSTKKYGTDSRTTTMAALEELQKDYGGYFRTRYVNGVTYLDWLEAWFNPSTNLQSVEVSDNLIDLSNSAEVENIFTAVVPIGNNSGKEVTIEGYKEDIHGANDRILVPQIVSLFTDAELNSGYHTKSDYQNAINRYGIIYKVQKFENADTKEKLWNYCIDWIKNNYVGSVVNYTLTAIDMHHIDGYVQKYLVGDRIKLIYPNPDTMASNPGETIEKDVTIISIKYNLHNPEKNSYAVGTPNSLVQKKYGSASGNKGGGGGGGHNQNDDEMKQQEYEAKLKATETQVWRMVISEKGDKPTYIALKEKYGDDAAENAQKAAYTVIMRAQEKVFDPDDEFDGEDKYVMPSILIDGPGSMISILSSQMANEHIPLSAKAAMDKAMNEALEKKQLTLDAVKSIVIGGLQNNITLLEPVKETLPLTEEGAAEYLYELGMYGKNPVLTISPEAFDDTLSGRMCSGAISVVKKVKAPLDNLLNKWGFKTESDITTASVQGMNGSVNSQLSTQGEDGTGDKPNVLTDGINGLSEYFDPDSGDGILDKIQTVITDGRDGSIVCGETDNPSKPPVTVNKTITYTGSDGKTHTIEGAIKATDFYDTTIGSLNANLINVNDLVVNHTALIANLQAGVANIRELFADYAKIADLNAQIAKIPTLTGIAASFSGNVSCSGLIADALYIRGSSTSQDVSKAVKYVLRTSAEGATNTTLEIQHFDGTKEELTFKRAAVPNMTGSWGGGTVRITNANDPNSPVYYQATVYQGTAEQASDNPNHYTGKIKYSTTGQGEYETGAVFFVDATSRYDAGRNSVRTMRPSSLGFGQQGTSLGTLSGVSPGRTIHFKVGDTYYYFLCT